MDGISVTMSIKDLKQLMAEVESKDFYRRQLSDIKKILNSGKNPEMMNAEILKMLEYVS